MRALLLLLSGLASAAQSGVPFPDAYVAMTRRALAADPFYASRLVAEVDRGMTALSADAKGVDLKALKTQLETGAVPPGPSAVLLAANSKLRPDQFQAILSGLESAKPGLGKLLAAKLGAQAPQPPNAIYTKDGRLEALFDGVDSSLVAGWDASPVPAQDYQPASRPSGLTKPVPKPMPFPSLANMMGESMGLKRPARTATAKLPPQPRADALTRGALATLMMRLANRQNWSDVAYGASGHRGLEDKVRAQWMSDDAKAEVNELFDQLTPEQRAIAEVAFAGGLAETPALRDVPDPVTLSWVEANYPARRR